MKNKIIFILLLLANLGLRAQHIDCQRAVQEFSADSLMRFVQELVGVLPVHIDSTQQLIRSRQYLHPGNELAQKYVTEQFSRYNFTVTAYPFNITGVNVIAYKPGIEFPNKSILFCAHYDCVGNSTQPFQGADDNASGVAALIETARLLRNVTTPYTIMLVAWDEEEIGLLGSRAWAPAGNGEIDPIAVVNMDMIAYDGNDDSLLMLHVQPNYAPSLQLAQRIAEINELYDSRLNVLIRNPGDPGSDHQAFWITGKNAIGYSEDYDNDFNPHWHRFSDSIHYFNVPYFNNMARLAVAATCELAQSGRLTSSHKVRTVSRTKLLFNNPVTDRLWVKTDSGTTLTSIKLTDTKARIVWQEIADPNQDYHQLPDYIDDGFYVLSVQTDDGQFVTKIILNRSTK
jgi:hypothetical protein